MEEQPRMPAGCDPDYLLPKDRPDFLPEALAYALPYEGTHIVVFYDRLQERGQPNGCPLYSPT